MDTQHENTYLWTIFTTSIAEDEDMYYKDKQTYLYLHNIKTADCLKVHEMKRHDSWSFSWDISYSDANDNDDNIKACLQSWNFDLIREAADMVE